MEMLLFWAPVLVIFFGMIILGLVKHKNRKLLAVSIAWLSLIAACVLYYYLTCLIFYFPIGMKDYASEVMAGIVITVFFLPIVICIILYIRSIIKKKRNDALLIGVLAWGLFPVFVWLYVMIFTAIFGGDPCP
ncbi:MAG: hypothetical protein IKN80_01655 [Clostridiales bacterium]|nr:hypothetical protein [Clostridiales bacterium]